MKSPHQFPEPIGTEIHIDALKNTLTVTGYLSHIDAEVFEIELSDHDKQPTVTVDDLAKTAEKLHQAGWEEI